MYDWSNWPLRTEPVWKSLLLAFLVVASACIVGFSSGEYIAGFIAFVLLMLALGAYWVPSRYRIDEEGISISRFGLVKKRSWRHYRRVARDETGIFLGVSSRPSPLDSFRGDSINCTGKVADIYEFAKRHIS